MFKGRGQLEGTLGANARYKDSFCLQRVLPLTSGTCVNQMTDELLKPERHVEKTGPYSG